LAGPGVVGVAGASDAGAIGRGVTAAGACEIGSGAEALMIEGGGVTAAARTGWLVVKACAGTTVAARRLTKLPVVAAVLLLTTMVWLTRVMLT